MKKLAVLMIAAAILAWGTGAWATLSLSETMYSNGAGGYGSTDYSGGLIGINTVQGSLAWTVTDTNGLYDYSYTYTPATAGKPRGVGAVAIEFGQLPSTNWSTSLTYISSQSPPAVTYPNLSSGLQTIDRTYADNHTYNSWTNAASPSTSNVDVATTFEGLQWVLNPSNPTGSSFTLDFTTNLAPVWGNIYMDGFNTTSNNGYSMLRNTNYDTVDTTPFSFNAANIQAGYIPTPGAVVPIPPSLLLLGGGLGGLGLMRKRWFKRS